MNRIQQTIKWVVYTLLIVNFFFYILEDENAALYTLGQTATWLKWSNAFANSIDELAWVDLIEASTWLLIILAIEMVVQLQDRGIFDGPLISGANAMQWFLYLILFAAAGYWGSLSHWLYVWDEALWVGGFAAIEMNLSEWRDEIKGKTGGLTAV